MEWIEYREKFRTAAVRAGKDSGYCDFWLDYAKKLWENHLPVIYTQEHLCLLVGYMPMYVYAVSNAPEKFYHHYNIRKKQGGFRLISEPLPNLKNIQRWILENILYQMEVSPFAKAYVPGLSVKDNVRFHRRQKKVLSLDIKSFFDSLSDWFVYQLFLEAGYSEAVSMMLMNLCCLDGCLPQGAPTSAALSNILLKEFDYAVGAFCNMNKIRYTRYADDMTFSGDFDERTVIRFVKKNLRKYHLELNEKKTRTRIQGQQQEVTGIVVNHKAQMPKQFRKDLRQQMYYIKKFGLESHLAYVGEERKNYLEHLYGQVTYALHINPRDHEMMRYRAFLLEQMKSVIG